MPGPPSGTDGLHAAGHADDLLDRLDQVRLEAREVLAVALGIEHQLQDGAVEGDGGSAHGGHPRDAMDLRQGRDDLGPGAADHVDLAAAGGAAGGGLIRVRRTLRRLIRGAGRLLRSLRLCLGVLRRRLLWA